MEDKSYGVSHDNVNVIALLY